MIHWEEGGPVPTVQSAEDEYLASLDEETDTIDAILESAGLTEKQRFVMELRYGLKDGVNYTQKQVSMLMGVSLKTVWEHEQAAKKKLDLPRRLAP